MTYSLFKIIHILGVVLLIGNVTITFIWKFHADATRDPVVLAFAQRIVTWTDWVFTAGGATLVMLGGYGMTTLARIDPVGTGWLLWSQIWFYAVGLVWLLILVPLQVLQSRQARKFAVTGTIPETYWRLCGYWNLVGIGSTVPFLYVLYLMIAKS